MEQEEQEEQQEQQEFDPIQNLLNMHLLLLESHNEDPIYKDHPLPVSIYDFTQLDVDWCYQNNKQILVSIALRANKELYNPEQYQQQDGEQLQTLSTKRTNPYRTDRTRIFTRQIYPDHDYDQPIHPGRHQNHSQARQLYYSRITRMTREDLIIAMEQRAKGISFRLIAIMLNVSTNVVQRAVNIELIRLEINQEAQINND